MTGWSAAAAAGCLALAAMVVSWPVPGRRARQRAVLAEAASHALPEVAASQRGPEVAGPRAVPEVAGPRRVLAEAASQMVPEVAGLQGGPEVAAPPGVPAETTSQRVPVMGASRGLLTDAASRALAAPRAVPWWSAWRGSAPGSTWWRRPGTVGGLLVAAGVAVAALWGGPVAAAVAGAYGLLALRGVVRRSRRRVREDRKSVV